MFQFLFLDLLPPVCDSLYDFIFTDPQQEAGGTSFPTVCLSVSKNTVFVLESQGASFLISYCSIGLNAREIGKMCSQSFCFLFFLTVEHEQSGNELRVDAGWSSECVLYQRVLRGLNFL